MKGGTTGGGVMNESNIRTFTLEKGGANALAEMLETFLPNVGKKNPVRVFTAEDIFSPKMKAPENQTTPAPTNQPKKMPAAKPDADGRSTQKLYDPSIKRISLLAEDQPTTLQPTAPPVYIRAFGNKLTIWSEDKDALARAQELIQYFMRSSAEGDFEVIRLKNASAVEAAKVLDEVFNGRDSSRSSRGSSSFGGGFPGFGGFDPSSCIGARSPSSSMPSTPSTRTEIIRVVADPTTNTLLVRASPLDMLRIRRLLMKSIDSTENDSMGVMRTFIIKPQYANADDVAQILTTVYHDLTKGSASSGSSGGFSGFSFSGYSSRSSDSSGSRPAPLSIGIDERTNSLVLYCTPAMRDNIQSLVDELDKGAKDTTRTVKIVSIQGIDPTLLEQAIAAISGTQSNNRRVGSSSMGSSGYPGGNNGLPSDFRGGSSGVGGYSGGYPGSGSSSYGRGGTPGGGFGGPPGGSFGGFGGPPGGGMGGPPGGSSRGSSGSSSRGSSRGGNQSSDDGGSDFFEQGVMDDPKQADFFDPQQSSDASSSRNNLNLGATLNDSGALHPVRYEEQQLAQAPAAPLQQGIFSAGALAPRTGRSNAEPLPELGIIIISNMNARAMLNWSSPRPDRADSQVRLERRNPDSTGAAGKRRRHGDRQHPDATLPACQRDARRQRYHSRGAAAIDGPGHSRRSASAGQAFNQLLVHRPAPRLPWINAILVAASLKRAWTSSSSRSVNSTPPTPASSCRRLS